MPDGRFLIGERRGTVKIARPGASPPVRVALEADELSDVVGSDIVLHGVVLHPEFRRNAFVYLMYTESPPVRSGYARRTVSKRCRSLRRAGDLARSAIRAFGQSGRGDRLRQRRQVVRCDGRCRHVSGRLGSGRSRGHGLACERRRQRCPRQSDAVPCNFYGLNRPVRWDGGRALIDHGWLTRPCHGPPIRYPDTS